MTLRLLRLLLIATLVLNGFSVSWAMPMGAMGHAGHCTDQHYAAMSQAVHHRANAHPGMDHRSTHMHGAKSHGEETSSSCCGSATCECGCVLTSVLPIPAACVLPHVLAIELQGTTAPELVMARTAAPFRPPAH